MTKASAVKRRPCVKTIWSRYQPDLLLTAHVKRGRFVMPTVATTAKTGSLAHSFSGVSRDPSTSYPRLQRRQAGLTTQQAATHDHIVRCRCCSAWMVVSEVVLQQLASDVDDVEAVCPHTTLR